MNNGNQNHEVRIGCSGWFYPEWKGHFYPESYAPSDYFSFYAKHFNTVEINSSFYRWPSDKTIEAWYHQAPPGFKYSLKVPRQITHFLQLQDTQDLIHRFYQLSQSLADKLGCILFQFPRNFVFHEDRLHLLLQQLNSQYQNVVEMRHPSWWCSQVFDAFAHAGIILCSVKGMDIPEDCMVMNDCIYLRCHGNIHYSYDYTTHDLSSLVQQLGSPKHLWVYFNNTFHGYAPRNALMMQDFLGV